MTLQSPALLADQTSAQLAHSDSRGLSRAGAASALLLGLLLLVELVVYVASSAPSLVDAAGWFNLFQTNRLLALIDFGLLELVGLLLFVPIYLALFAALRRAGETGMRIATVLALAGTAANLATNKLFVLLTLSDLYAAAGSALQKSQFLAMGQAALAVSAVGGIAGSAEGGIPVAAAGLLISAVMLRSRILGRAVAYVGLLANGTAVAMYLNAAAAPAPAGSPFFGPFFLLSVTWFFLIARALFRLDRPDVGQHPLT